MEIKIGTSQDFKKSLKHDIYPGNIQYEYNEIMASKKFKNIHKV